MGQPYVGEIKMFAGSFAPAGWAFCDGSLLPISEYETLFNLIGTTYGGDGQQTFGLPNLQGRAPLHQGTSAQGNTYTLAQLAGVEQVVLNVNQIPLHSHPMLVSTDAGTEASPAGSLLAASPAVALYNSNGPNHQLAGGALSDIGGSQPHDNTMPFLAVSFIISLFGIFPSQT